MKTSVVAARYGGKGFRRGRLPQDGEESDAVAYSRLTFQPRHEEVYQPFDPKTLKVGKKKKRIAPDLIYVGNEGYHRENWNDVRVIPEGYVNCLDEIDRRMDQLAKEREELKAEAFRHGRAIKKSDVVPESKPEEIEPYGVKL